MMLSSHLILCFSSFCLQSFPASGSFPMSQLFTSGGQSIGVSASALVLPLSIQSWFTLGLIGLIQENVERNSSLTIVKPYIYTQEGEILVNLNNKIRFVTTKEILSPYYIWIHFMRGVHEIYCLFKSSHERKVGCPCISTYYRSTVVNDFAAQTKMMWPYQAFNIHHCCVLE